MLGATLGFPILTGYDLGQVEASTVGRWSLVFKDFVGTRLLRAVQAVQPSCITLCSSEKMGYAYNICNVCIAHPDHADKVLQGCRHRMGRRQQSKSVPAPPANKVRKPSTIAKTAQLTRCIERINQHATLRSKVVVDHESGQSAAVEDAGLRPAYCVHHKYKGSVDAATAVLAEHGITWIPWLLWDGTAR